LERGDIIATGTPEGVGPIKEGDVLSARIASVGTLSVGVIRR
ncbi:MAG: fumarylacetoacetate hydrolase family protein, partial [Candidatus Methanofastidiosa archaeon]|nr:fumarylacetoacetate hydrolase family protein [Candidatus Methanofastidiosa archaeon]